MKIKTFDEFVEAMVAGDHGTPENIASGETTGAVTNNQPKKKKPKKLDKKNED